MSVKLISLQDLPIYFSLTIGQLTYSDHVRVQRLPVGLHHIENEERLLFACNELNKLIVQSKVSVVQYFFLPVLLDKFSKGFAVKDMIRAVKIFLHFCGL